MVRNFREWTQEAWRFACLLMVLGMSGCATFEESGLPGSAASMAHNQMMHVSKESGTFGYYRLTTLARMYPDLEYFIRKRGVPDFLAETSNEGRHYFIVYYLADREAFAGRPRIGRRKALEFAGPYPITPKEVVILEKLRDGGSQGARWGGIRREGAPEDEAS